MATPQNLPFRNASPQAEFDCVPVALTDPVHTGPEPDDMTTAAWPAPVTLPTAVAIDPAAIAYRFKRSDVPCRP